MKKTTTTTKTHRPRIAPRGVSNAAIHRQRRELRRAGDLSTILGHLVKFDASDMHLMVGLVRSIADAPKRVGGAR